MQFRELARVSDVPENQMKKYNIDEIEITIANIRGNYLLLTIAVLI